MDRRDFLKVSGAGLVAGSLSPLLEGPLQAAMLGAPSKKMLVIFLRGGVDSVNMVIPNGDSEYNDLNRPTLFIPEEDSLDLDNDFARAHPALGALLDEVPSDDLAFLHRVAYENQSRSHFSSQQYWENATPGAPLLEEGWINRMIGGSRDLSDLALPAASISTRLQVLFRGSQSIAHIQDLQRYQFGDDPVEAKFLGEAATGSGNGSGLLGVYGLRAGAGAYDEKVQGMGLALAASLDEVSDLDPTTYEPEGGATYPSADDPGDFPGDGEAFAFFRQLKESVLLLKETECRVVGVELGDFDTHSGQAGQLDRLLRILSHGLQSVYADTSSGGSTLWDDLLVLTLSEFGRTSVENGSFGTDHGEAGCLIAAGGGVSGGVYNCDAETWDDGDLLSTPAALSRYVAHRTDYRAVLAEVIDRHFGEGGILDDAIPGWDELTGDEFDYLDFLES